MYRARLPVNEQSRISHWKSTLTPNYHDIAEVLDDPQMQSSGIARVHQRSIPKSRRSPRSHRSSCDHDDMLRQLLHNVEKLSDKYEEINKKVDTIMNWMRPSQHLDKDYSFGADGVFGTEGDNHEEVERKMEEGDTMRETGVGEFERGCTVMETVARGIESKAETWEIGSEAIEKNIKGKAVVESIKWETEARGVVIDTTTRNIEREMDVVDIEKGSNERTRMYAKVFTRKRKNLVEIDFCKATMFVYDPDKGCITSDQLKDDLKTASIIVPLLLKEINIDLDADNLAIERNTKTTKQVVS
ncbi:Hypothetical predicted protein [Olea europaea subsp. europaea]|uniref:Uncharacterized protein n=1 Tax=Olea europaea subsp. europaea TaxID=158383 RepID=A0A8S0TQB9_OLEEU|nr:Hypothetical predicted protein [Olea europaea subsp. europaea]